MFFIWWVRFFKKSRQKVLTIDIITKHFAESWMQIWDHGIYRKVNYVEVKLWIQDKKTRIFLNDLMWSFLFKLDLNFLKAEAMFLFSLGSMELVY